MAVMAKNTYYMEGLKLRSTSLGVVNIPKEILEKLGWGINTKMTVDIVHQSVHGDNREWKVIEVARMVDSEERMKALGGDDEY